MNVQELFKSLDIDRFADYYNMYDNLISGRYRSPNEYINDIATIKKCIERMLAIEVVEHKDIIIFSVPNTSTICLDSYVVHKDELVGDEHIDHYAYEFDSWRDILGYQVSTACKKYIDDDLQFAASILYEMTFFGYAEDEQEDNSRNHLEEIQEAISDVTDGKYESLEDVISELGFVDKRDDSQKEFDNSIRELEGEFLQDLLYRLYDLEIHYLNISENQ